MKSILDEVKAQEKRKWRRDHCAIFLGYHLALRVGEAAILERRSFEHLGEYQVDIRTLKSVPRIPLQCSCGRRWRVSARRMGQAASCPVCSSSQTIPTQKIDTNPPFKTPPVIESHLVDYVQDYLENEMRPGQRWFFEAKEGQHISRRQLSIVFSHYALSCGLDAAYSWHALRHARGVVLWERFKDLNMVQKMLRQASMTAAQIYVNMSPEEIQRARSVLDKDASKLGLN